MSNNCPIPPDCYDLEPVPICVRPVADPFACAQPAYLIGFCDAGTQKYRLEYPLGTALAGLYENWVQLPSTECKCQAKPPVDAPATTCGADTTVKATDLLSQAVHTAPGTALLVKLCPADPKFDREFVILCAPDGTKVITQNVTKDNAPLGTAPTIEAWTLAGTPYAGSIAALTDCGSEKVDLADSESYCAAGTNYSRIDVVDVITKAIIGTLWLNDAGTVVAAPVGAVKGTCEQIASNTAIIAQLTAANVTLAALLAEQDKELSFTTPIQICVGGVGHLVRQRSVYDSEAATPVSLVAEYTADGVTWTTTAPVGTITLGECVPCKITEHLEFAWYKQAGATSLQSKVLGFYQGINADFSQSVVGDYEVVFTIDGVYQAGNAAGTIWPGNYPVPSTSIQSFADYLNNHPANTAPKDVWSAAGTVGNEALIIAATAGGNPPNHAWDSVAFAHYTAGAHDYMTIKGSPDSADVEIATASTCTKIEVIKERNSCTKEMELYGYDSKGKPIAGFDANNIFLGEAKEVRRDICVTMKPVAPATVGVRWDIKEIETTSPCGDVTVKYFDPDTSPMVEVDVSLIECINGEGKCPCCPDETTTPSLEKWSHEKLTTAQTWASPASMTSIEIVVEKGTAEITVNGLMKRYKEGESIKWSELSSGQIAGYVSISAVSGDILLTFQTK